METQYRDMAVKAKEMREALALQQETTAKIRLKSDNLVGALPAAEMKLIPTNQKAAQIKQVTEITKGNKTEILPPQIVKTGQRPHRQFNF